MGSFAQEIINIRKHLGHKTARPFFQFLAQKGVSFNYSYYMQIEKGQLPSDKVVKDIVSAIDKAHSDRLVLAYCRDLFPSSQHLFGESKTVSLTASKTSSAPKTPEKSTPHNQKELTLRQVATIGKSRAHYHLFLICTLSRRPLEHEELTQWFSQKQLNQILQDFTESKVLTITNDKIEASTVEAKFPDSYNEELKKLYATFDQWDEEFGNEFAFEYLTNRMFIRRVSPRYISVIRNHINVLYDLVRMSDESDIKYNDSTLLLKVTLRQGKIPG